MPISCASALTSSGASEDARYSLQQTALLGSLLLLARTGVHAYAVHSRDPKLLHEDLQGGHQRYGEQQTHQPEEGAHDEDREDHHDRVQGYGPAHHDGLDHVYFDLVDDGV